MAADTGAGTFNGARLLTAMVTPFNDNLEVDLERAAQLAQRLVDQGNQGLVVTGTTGESPTLTAAEKLALYETVLKTVGDRAEVWAGTGNNDTVATVELSKQAAALGVTGLMLVTPYYNKPTQEGLYRHYAMVAEAVDLPIMLYNVPGRTSVNLLPATVARLAEDFPNIQRVKEASGLMDQVTEILVRAPRLHVYSGDDGNTLPMMAIGAVGVVSVAGHVVAPGIRTMIDAFVAGDTDEAARLHRHMSPLFRALFVETNPGPVKAAVKLQGLDVGPLRPPLAEPRDETIALLRETLAQMGPAAGN
ncbi:MAG TPA: 4-hydroxy-tetrahydrodipicolinate synthase [Sphingobacteriaceae bacterium]|nr:4-hydroxy-tetrahydrodipicolinate synthase [Sphingobacteriaceae bacterium]